MIRPLFCPICGRRVNVETDGQWPEVHKLPDHVSAIETVNLCQGAVITVTIDFDRCQKCGARTAKHPTGLCMKCCALEEKP